MNAWNDPKLVEAVIGLLLVIGPLLVAITNKLNSVHSAVSNGHIKGEVQSGIDEYLTKQLTNPSATIFSLHDKLHKDSTSGAGNTTNSAPVTRVSTDS